MENLTINPHLFFYDSTKFCVVGDVHGSIQEFKTMLTDNKGISIDKKTNKFIITDSSKYMKHILVGDYIDKGDYRNIKQTIELIYNNLEHFIVCIGNHEYWVAEYLLGKIKPSNGNTAIIGQWFQTVVLLLHDVELREKFFAIYKKSFHSIETPIAIITHAPTAKQYLNKSDGVSLKFQRNLQLTKFSDEDKIELEIKLYERDKFFTFLKEEASHEDKYHLFGHTEIPEVFKYKNKICLDTGCISGGSLSVAIFNDDKLEFKSYKSIRKESKTFFTYFSEKVANRTENLICENCGAGNSKVYKDYELVKGNFCKTCKEII